MNRLQEAGLEIWRLPFGTFPEEPKPPATDPHVPILVSKNLSGAARIVVVFGEPVQDLGIWAYRSVGEDGVNFGSAVNFTKHVLGEGTDKTDTALVIANTGQLLWLCASSRAVTQRTWEAADRPAGPWGQATRSWRNKIPGNKDLDEHIKYVFEHVLWPRLDKKSPVDVIGLSEGGQGALEYLQKRCQCSSNGIIIQRKTTRLTFFARGSMEAIHLGHLFRQPVPVYRSRLGHEHSDRPPVLHCIPRVPWPRIRRFFRRGRQVPVRLS